MTDTLMIISPGAATLGSAGQLVSLGILKTQQSLDTHQLRIFANWGAFFTGGTAPIGMALFGVGTFIGAQEGVTVTVALGEIVGVFC